MAGKRAPEAVVVEGFGNGLVNLCERTVKSLTVKGRTIKVEVNGHSKLMVDPDHKNQYEEKTLRFYQLGTVSDPKTLQASISELLKHVPLRTVVGYIMYGLSEGPARVVRQGADERLSPTQQQALKLIVSLYTLGACTGGISEAIDMIKKNGIPEDVFHKAIAAKATNGTATATAAP